MTQSALLRARAEGLAGALPGLLAGADRLAASVQPGLHGRRRSGPGESFWQYRAAQPQDGMRGIDWRRSARGDDLFARQKEWQVAQSVQLWVDPSVRMDFGHPAKAQRAAELALALAILAERGGERIGLLGSDAPKAGQVQLGRLADALAQGCVSDPDPLAVQAHGQLVLISDFLGGIEDATGLVVSAADRGVRAVLCQVIAPEEADFPYAGRTIFEMPGQSDTHETHDAAALKPRYQGRLAQRQAALRQLADRVGGQFLVHVTDRPAADALIWIARAVEGPR